MLFYQQKHKLLGRISEDRRLLVNEGIVPVKTDWLKATPIVAYGQRPRYSGSRFS